MIRPRPHRLSFEPLEQRAMLSATVQFHHDLVNPLTGGRLDSASLATAQPADIAPYGSSTPGSAFSPAAIRSAYGIDSISGDGTGQTIAIVDAFRNPNIASDLAAFSTYFGLPAANLTILNQTGGTDVSNIPIDAGWAQEIALDVEWAHAIAPGASIVLVEANSNSFADLFTAIDTARNYAGVSVVSMSFGGGETISDVSNNSHFTTPSGHNGVTFVASTGDSGSPSSYPAYSPNVVAVGGTSLTLSGGNYGSEVGWSGSGGGQSTVQSKPAYQNGVNSSAFRQNPDVAFDANPNTAVAVYDSYNGAGTAGNWYQVGGTSLSAPCWAGLFAIVNQLRVNQGLTTLDGPTQTLPGLYNLPSADFHDILSGSNGGFTAKAGYDLVTGLGTPVANLLVPSLAGNPTPDLTITKSHVGNFHPNDINVAYTIMVSNVGDAATSGTVTVTDVLPTGLTLSSMGGSGWSYNPTTQTASRSDSLAFGASYPALTVFVNVDANAPSSVINTATVSGGGETNTTNDSASDPTAIGFLEVLGTTPSLSGGSLSAGTTTIAVNFNSAASGAGTASNYQLQSAGADGLLGTSDDVPMTLTASYSGTTATLSFAPLTENAYRLAVKDTITDTGGVKLDGNGDNLAGGNWTADFTVVLSSSLLSNTSTFFSGGNNPLNVAVGDFNGDGKPDLAVVNNPLSTGTTSIGIFLGDGKGGFTAGTAITSGLSSPYAAAVGDFNGDGKADLAVANFGSNTVGIFLGNGSGGFTLGTPVAVGTSPLSLAVGDFNNDGKADLVAANYGSNTLSILRGNGSGGFTTTSINSSGTNPRAVAVADFNNDGKLDVAAVNYGSNMAVIFLGNGSGSFTAQTPVSTGGTGPRSIAVADFNGDSKPDIVVGNHDNSTLGVLRGNGSGGLLTATTYTTGGASPRGVAVADFNGDGKADIAVSNSASSNVGVLLGNGSGSFATATTFSTNTTYGAFGIAGGDFNGDGRPDLAVTDSGVSASSDAVTIFLDFYGPPLTASPSDWTVAGTAGMTLKRTADGMLHFYQTGTTTDVVAPRAYVNVSNIVITGRNSIDDALTVDFSGGNPIPGGGVNFNGGSGGGNSLLISGATGDDSVTMTATQITDNGSAPITYSNVAFFGFDFAGGSNNLLIDQATVNLNRDNAISDGTTVTLNGGMLNFNGHAGQIGKLFVGGGGQVVNASSLNSQVTSVSNGTLTAASIVSDTLTIGTSGPAAAVNPPAASPAQYSLPLAIVAPTTAVEFPSTTNDSAPFREGEAPAEPFESAGLFATTAARQEPRPPQIAQNFLTATNVIPLSVAASPLVMATQSAMVAKPRFVVAETTTSLSSSSTSATSPMASLVSDLKPPAFSMEIKPVPVPAAAIASTDFAIAQPKPQHSFLDREEATGEHSAADFERKTQISPRDGLETVLQQLASRHIIARRAAAHQERLHAAVFSAIDAII